jgi:hypothetical protein
MFSALEATSTKQLMKTVSNMVFSIFSTKHFFCYNDISVQSKIGAHYETLFQHEAQNAVNTSFTCQRKAWF